MSSQNNVSCGAPQSTRAAIGLNVQTLTPQIARQIGVAATLKGVVISGIDPASDAAAQGLQARDVILSINQRPTTTAQEAAAAVEAARKAGRKNVLLLVQRGSGPPRYVGVEVRKG